MTPSRRDLALAAAAAALGEAAPSLAAARDVRSRGRPSYQVISQLTARPGQRERLAALMARAAKGLPGCLAYVIAADPDDAESLWVTELWTDREAHERSLQTEQVASAIARARPLMVGFLRRVEIAPIAGFGAAFERG